MGVEALNRKYRIEQGDIFFLFHRPRLWNPREKIWIGYERKRGKIADLNSLLRGSSEERFSLVVGDTIIGEICDVPGMRENGGQYTHSAIWVAMAFARLYRYREKVYHISVLELCKDWEGSGLRYWHFKKHIKKHIILCTLSAYGVFLCAKR